MNPAIANLRLETNRLVLREMHMDDADFLFNEWSDPKVTRFMCDEDPLQKREQAEEFLRQFQLPEKNPHLNWWGIESKADGHLIGTCGYIRWDQKHHRAEIGYDLCPDAWGQGLMPEVLQAIVRFGFQDMKINRIEATVHVENIRSQRVLTKLGFQREGFLREYYCRNGVYNHQVQYSLLKREWFS